MAKRWPHDDELERLFQNGSEKHFFEYDPEAWKNMEVLLNNQRNRKVLLWIAGLLLALLLTFLLFAKNGVNGAASSENEIGKSQITEENIALKSKNENQDLITNIPQESEAIISVESEEHVLISNDKIRNSNAQQLQNQASKFKNNPGLYDVDYSHRQEEKTRGISQGSNFKSIPEHAKTINVVEARSFSSHDLLEIPRTPFENPESLHNQFSSNSPSIIELENNKKGFWEFGFFGGVELSATPNGSFDDTDLSFGLSTSHFISDRWGVRINGSYTHDYYTAGKGDYSPPKGYWKNQKAPSSTLANCRMLNVSFGLVHNIPMITHGYFHVGANIGSNFMLEEKYYYRFEDPEDNWSNYLNSGNNTLFNSLELNVGYNHKLKNNIEITLEPYARLPINGIGHGQVMLSSGGIRLYAKWATKN